jgi:hypothetical protein
VASCVCGGHVCVLSSSCSCSAWNSAAPVVQTAGGCWNMCVLGPWGPCMVTYIATLLGLAQINRIIFP